MGLPFPARRRNFLASLRSELSCVAAEPDVQLRDPGFLDDALLDLEAVLQMAAHGDGAQYLSEEERAACEELNAEMDRLLGDAPRGNAFWSEQGVRSHPVWASLRLAARATMACLPES